MSGIASFFYSMFLFLSLGYRSAVQILDRQVEATTHKCILGHLKIILHTVTVVVMGPHPVQLAREHNSSKLGTGVRAEGRREEACVQRDHKANFQVTNTAEEPGKSQSHRTNCAPQLSPGNTAE